MDARQLGQYGGFGLFTGGIVLPVLWPRPQARSAKRPIHNPSVEIIIPAYREQSTIGAKVVDCVRELDSYTGSTKLTVIASDVATANAASTAWPGVQVVTTGRDGKASAINAAVRGSRADICIVTDANCKIRPDGWLAQATKDLTTVDLVSCHKMELDSQDRYFWAYERLVKSQPVAPIANPTLAIVGELLAFWRDGYRPISSNAICDDISIAVDFASRGLVPGISKVIHSEELSAMPADHWERRVRIAHGLIMTAVPQLPVLLQSPLGRQFVAHKLWRATLGNVGYWMWLAIGSSRGSKVSICMTGVTVYAALRYSGRLRPDARPNAVLAPFAMQTLPARAIFRIAASARHECPGPVPHDCPRDAVWRKVAR